MLSYKYTFTGISDNTGLHIEYNESLPEAVLIVAGQTALKRK